ncbi:Furin-like protease 2 [Caligus rogercresseyi]|uniref:Furin-like protease 2 n=1 Tax=Caligus rogercresseyi TaxID=217165 RepID=A0A7T8QVG6_CALRO|nr:Furin-like protease 2 [Caligus rogercresseyi]
MNSPFIIIPLTSLLLVLSSAQHYQNQFAVYIPRGEKCGGSISAGIWFVNMGQIGALEDYFLFDHPRISKRSTDASTLHAILLTLNPEVKWFEQQKEKNDKTGFSIMEPRHKDLPPHLGKDRASLYRGTKVTLCRSHIQLPVHLNAGARNGYDMNVKPAWERGYSGKGVVVTILDDGIQMDHPDLVANYDPRASTDINDNDADPMPQDDGNNKHGTRCAGEVAAGANNGVCGVGIAYNASIGGVRMLDGVVNDAVEARALSLNPDHVDIYSASWGQRMTEKPWMAGATC